MERVQVRRVSVITPDAGEPETVAGEWEGALRTTPAELLLTFTEPVEGGKVFNRVIWRDGILTVDRRGAVSSRIVFRTGETVGVDLTIPPLSIPMTVTTEEVLLLPTPNGVGFRVLFSSVISGERRRTEMTVVATPV
ncbi:MAG: DUF1934 domain-containing protein [Clostridia bacterium]|nr:DUF1934 domain-containing protein [Clostridia bacterium]MBP5429192.1 DUF1934 domain-containing protein [Clostridia bacterium]